MRTVTDKTQAGIFYGTHITECPGSNFPAGPAALENVNLSVSQGEFVSVIGPSGAGKTTLFRILNGMDTPTSGAVLLIDGTASMSEPLTRTGAKAGPPPDRHHLPGFLSRGKFHLPG
ncbi:MAG: ATP-binding cassette domain-containing protein [Clostridium sp.]